MFIVSSYTKVTQNNKIKKWQNTISKKAIGYSDNFESIIPELLLQQLETKSEDLEESLRQLILCECLYRGLVIPEKHIDNEIEYLQGITIFSRVNNGFFNSPVIDCNTIKDKQGNQFAFIGIPCDHGASRPGSRFGTQLLRERSCNINFRGNGVNHLFNLKNKQNVFQFKNVYDFGDIYFPKNEFEICLNKVKEAFNHIPSNVIPISIGGDHSFTLPILEALYLKRAKPFTVIQLDNHLDIQLWGEFTLDNQPKKLDKVSHSNFISWMHNKMPELKLLQLGVSEYQSIGEISQETYIGNYLSNIGAQITDVDILLSHSISEILDKIPIDTDVYLTIDVDVINSSVMKQTGFPSPTGITYQQLYQITKAICERNNIIGIDIMEFGGSHKRDEHYDMSTCLCFLILEIIQQVAVKNILN